MDDVADIIVAGPTLWPVVLCWLVNLVHLWASLVGRCRLTLSNPC
jgi:hypothetical protein